MGAQRQAIQATRLHIHGMFHKALHIIRVKKAPRIDGFNDLAERFQILNGPDFVIHADDADQNRILRHQITKNLRIHISPRINRTPDHINTVILIHFKYILHRRMLNGRGNNAASAQNVPPRIFNYAFNQHIIAFGSPGRKIYLIGLRADLTGDGFSGTIHALLIVHAQIVQRRRVAKKRKSIRHRANHFRM